MTNLRATKKLLDHLDCKFGEEVPSQSALGDWFGSRIVVDRRPLVILVSGNSLLPILAPARQLSSLPTRLPNMVAERLLRMDVEGALIRQEFESMTRVAVTKTNDRSVVGTLTDFASMTPHVLPQNRAWELEDLYSAELELAHSPCRVSSPDAVWPDSLTVELLKKKWAKSGK